jgi:ABC-2 type transport system ATP-binding protein
MSRVELKGVSKTIRKNTVVSDVSATLDGGRIYGFQGINGSGKTMLMRLISGLIRPTAGSVSIDGKTLWKDISFPGSIGILLENPSFLGSYTGFQNLRMLASIRKRIDDSAVMASLERVVMGGEPG